MASKLGYAYTRYADDITFSASGEAADQLRKLLWRTHAIVKDEGFTMHPDKTRIKAAIAIHERIQLRYWDSLILATAKRHQCDTVFREDFSHHQDYDGERVTNPFT